MHNSEIIPALIARIRQNNTDNVVIHSKLYNLLNNVFENESSKKVSK